MIYCPTIAYTPSSAQTLAACAKKKQVRQFPCLTSKYYSYLQYSQYYRHTHVTHTLHATRTRDTRTGNATRSRDFCTSCCLIKTFSTRVSGICKSYASDSGASIAKLLASARESLALDCKITPHERHCKLIANAMRGGQDYPGTDATGPADVWW